MALDVREISLLADYFVICSGNSDRQINAIIDEVLDKEEENQVEVRRVEGKDGGKWVLILVMSSFTFSTLQNVRFII